MSEKMATNGFEPMPLPTKTYSRIFCYVFNYDMEAFYGDAEL